MGTSRQPAIGPRGNPHGPQGNPHMRPLGNPHGPQGDSHMRLLKRGIHLAQPLILTSKIPNVTKAFNAYDIVVDKKIRDKNTKKHKKPKYKKHHKAKKASLKKPLKHKSRQKKE